MNTITDIKDVKLLTREDIIAELKSMVVGEGKELPWKRLTIITPNPDYDPDNFSQEIEDSEEAIDYIAEMKKQISRSDFDWVWHNTLSEIPSNSDKWLENHRKQCIVKLHPMKILLQCICHEDGVRDYYDEFIVDKIINFGKPYGGIVKIG